MPKWNNSYHPLSYLCSYYCFWELLSSESYYYLILLKIPFVFLKKKKGFFVLVISGDGCYFIDIYLTSLSFTPSLPCSILSLHASPLRTTQTPTAPPRPENCGFSSSLPVFARFSQTHFPTQASAWAPLPLFPFTTSFCLFPVFFLWSAPNLLLFSRARISSAVESYSFEVSLDFSMAVILISHLPQWGQIVNIASLEYVGGRPRSMLPRRRLPLGSHCVLHFVSSSWIVNSSLCPYQNIPDLPNKFSRPHRAS